MASLSLDPVRPARGGIGLVGAGIDKQCSAVEAGSNRVAGVRAKENPRYVLRGLIPRFHALSLPGACFSFGLVSWWL